MGRLPPYRRTAVPPYRPSTVALLQHPHFPLPSLLRRSYNENRRKLLSEANLEISGVLCHSRLAHAVH